MAKQEITVAPGETKMAERLEIQKSSEPWAEYQFSDGTIYKFKYVMTEVWRVDDEFDDEGNPRYFFKAQPMAEVRSPKELTRKR